MVSVRRLWLVFIALLSLVFAIGCDEDGVLRAFCASAGGDGLGGDLESRLRQSFLERPIGVGRPHAEDPSGT